MVRAYSLDLRERVVAAIEGGLSTHQAATRFSIGIATAGSWARLKRSQGDVRPGQQGKPKGSVLDAHADFILGVLRTARHDPRRVGRSACRRARREGRADGGLEVPRPARLDA